MAIDDMMTFDENVYHGNRDTDDDCHVDDDIAIGANAWEVTMVTASIVSLARTLTAAF